MIGRDDGFGPERVHQNVLELELEKVPFAQGRQFALVGFCCDEGVKRNKGRVGAAHGPEHLRKSLANLALPGDPKNQIIDVGDIFCTDSDLEKAQTDLGAVVGTLLAKRYIPIVLGGGHETAWGHFQGIAPHSKNTLIVNFDAHYDLRPLIDDRWGSSGSPFYQIAEFCKTEKRPFHYLCIGVQGSSNTDSLLKRAAELHVHSVMADTLHTEGLASTQTLLSKLLDQHDSVYLSICLDVFAHAYAPGVSAPQALGLTPWQVLPLLRKIVSSGKLRSADVVELCPALDQDSQTAKLGASLIWEILTGS